MSSRINYIFIFIVFSLIFFVGGYILGQSPIAPITLFSIESTTPDEAQSEFSTFWDVWNLVHTRFFEQPVDDVLLTESAIEGMLAALNDPYTRYLSPEDEAAAREEMVGEFQGIGAVVEDVDGFITIVSPIDGSPAEAAGLMPGDRIRMADDIDLVGMTTDEVVAIIRGPAGTAVRLFIERNGEFFEVVIVRDVIKLDYVRGEVFDNGIAYLRLSRFGNETAQDMEAKLTDLLADNPIGLILDLRRNPGGDLDTVVNIADLFLNEGTILIERFGNGRETVFESDDEGLAQEIPMVVLVDEGSASASEVLAGAIQARDRGILIGQTTFGKGKVQTWFPLSNGGGVRITTARWLTPDEVWLNGDGLIPDYLIPQPEVGEDPEGFKDAQLQAAVDYLLGELATSPTLQPSNGG